MLDLHLRHPPELSNINRSNQDMFGAAGLSKERTQSMIKKMIKADSAKIVDDDEGNSEVTCGSNSRSRQLTVREPASGSLSIYSACPELPEPDALTIALQVTETHRVPSTLCDDARRQMQLDPVAYYASIGPSDALESALARVIVGVTNSAMDCLGRAARTDERQKSREVELGLGLKASQTLAELIGVFDKHRGRDRPKVAVGQVNVQAGGKAIVGNVQHPERPERDGEAYPLPRMHHKPTDDTT